MSDKILADLDNATKQASQSDPDEDPSKLQEVITKVNEAINSKATRDQLALELKALTKGTLKIEDAFRNIEKTLGDIVKDGAEGVGPTMQADLESLLKRWKVLHKTYVDALWDSREVAGSAQTTADDFVDVFLVHLESIDDVQKQAQEIRDYIETINASEQKAQHFSDQFKTLSHDVAFFQADWKNLVERNAQKFGNEQVEKLTKEIGDLEVTVSTIQKKIIGYSVAAGVLATTAAITGVVGFWFPGAWIASLVTALGSLSFGTLLVQAMNERDVLNREITTKKEERAKIENILKVIQQLDAGLLASKDDFAIVCDKLGALATIWAIIKSDLHMIQRKLEIATSDTRKLPLYKIRLQNAIITYGVLSKGLREYQITVVPPPKPES